MCEGLEVNFLCRLLPSACYSFLPSASTSEVYQISILGVHWAIWANLSVTGSTTSMWYSRFALGSRLRVLVSVINATCLRFLQPDGLGYCVCFIKCHCVLLGYQTFVYQWIRISVKELSEQPDTTISGRSCSRFSCCWANNTNTVQKVQQSQYSTKKWDLCSSRVARRDVETWEGIMTEGFGHGRIIEF